MNRMRSWLLSAALAMAVAACAEVIVQTEHLNPADPAWHFKTIPRPSKSDIAAEAKVTVVGNQLEPAGGDGAVVAKPASIEHLWVVFKTHLDIGYTDRIEEVLRKYRVNMMEGALKVVEHRARCRRSNASPGHWPAGH